MTFTFIYIKGSAWRYVIVCILVASSAASDSFGHQDGTQQHSPEFRNVRHVDYHIQPRQEAPLRIMAVGDSITHMRDGDTTWRYRLWQWFQENNISMQFVGPYTGTALVNQPNPPRPSTPSQARPQWDKDPDFDGGYAYDTDPAFLLNNTNHFAASGRALRDAKDWIQEAMELHPADMLLVLLGVNDLAFCCWAEETIGFMRQFIANARKVNPRVQIAVADVPYQNFATHSLENTINYNGLMLTAVRKFNTPESPVHLVKLSEKYGCGSCECPGGFDGLHPNALGDYHIAYAFSEVLANKFHMAPCPISFPTSSDDPAVARYLPAPKNFRVEATTDSIVGTWDSIYGVYGYHLEVTKPDSEPEIFDTGSNWWYPDPHYSGAPYSVRVAAYARNQTGEWSETQTVHALKPAKVKARAPRSTTSQTPNSNIFKRDEEKPPLPCIGGVSPQPKPCNPGSYGSVPAHVGTYKPDVSFLLLSGFVLVALWFGRRMGLFRFAGKAGWSRLGEKR